MSDTPLFRNTRNPVAKLSIAATVSNTPKR